MKPTVTDQNDSRKYLIFERVLMKDYDQLAEEYSKHRKINPKVLSELIGSAEIGTDSRVLEVGCGNGNYIISLNEITGCVSFGLDSSNKMLSIARKRTENVTFYEGEAERIQIDEKFDLIFSVDLIHHLNNPAKYLKSAYRNLKHGGRILTVTDSEWVIRNRKPLSIYFPETVSVDLKRYPRVEKIKTEMKKAGFVGLKEKLVENKSRITDLGPYHEKTFSCLHLISAEAFESGLNRLKNDLKDGSVPKISRYILLFGVKI